MSQDQKFRAAAEIAAKRSSVSVDFEDAQSLDGRFAAARYRLANGLRVVLMPDHRAPIFAYQTWLSVGSRDEDPERTGMAHLLEHLMFKATKRFEAGTFDREMERRGCQTNAATYVDWTYYTNTLSARGDHFSTVVDFESDRLTGLKIEGDSFWSELDVVKNERRMSVDDDPDGRLGERLFSQTLPEHPYGRPVIGHAAHLDAMTPEAISQFYQKYYAPSNAVVVCVGDINLVDALCEIAQKYSSLLGESVIRPKIKGVLEEATSLQSRLTLPVSQRQIHLAWPLPHERHHDFAALRLWADILFSGDTARLYQRLVVNDKLCSDVSGGVYGFSKGGLSEVSLTLLPGVDEGECIAKLKDEMARMPDGLEDAEWEKAQSSAELSLLEGLVDVEDLAEALGYAETNSGDFSLVFGEAARYRNVVRASMTEVATRYFLDREPSVVFVDAEGSGDESKD